MNQLTENEKHEIDQFIEELKPIVKEYKTRLHLKDKQIAFMIAYKYGLNEIQFQYMPSGIKSVSYLQKFLNVALKKGAI